MDGGHLAIEMLRDKKLFGGAVLREQFVQAVDIQRQVFELLLHDGPHGQLVVLDQVTDQQLIRATGLGLTDSFFRVARPCLFDRTGPMDARRCTESSSRQISR